MEDMEDMKASVDVNPTGVSKKASTKASMEVTEDFPEVMEVSMEFTFMET